MKHLMAAGLMMLAGAATAQELAVKLTAAEITQALEGNTAVGLWEGVPYRQYFGADGVTFFAQDDARTARGEWRVDAEVDEFQSLWPGDEDWEGWFVMTWEDQLYWVSRATPPTPFDVLDGEQLVAE